MHAHIVSEMIRRQMVESRALGGTMRRLTRWLVVLTIALLVFIIVIAGLTRVIVQRGGA